MILTARRPLSAATLSHHADRVSVPGYDRSALTPSVVHLSVGYFHRAHQAVYFEDLARMGEREWGMTGVGLRRHEMHTALAPQDWLYTVVERGPAADRARVVGAMQRYVFAPDHPGAVVAALADSRTRLVTLTITVAGYEVGAGEPDCSALELLVDGLERRRRAGLPPFTILSCDNHPANGEMARAAVLATALHRDGGLAEWIDAHGAFPNSMVDRITPMTTDEDRERLAQDFGVVDRWPVMTEPYSEWIVEDTFCDVRPPLDLVGARFVSDVHPYSLIKTRLLNAAHCALGHLGTLAGLGSTAEAMRDPVLAPYVDRLTAEEIAPLLPDVADLDLEAYRRTVIERLRNPKIGDRLTRLCRAGDVKVPRHVVPSLAAARDRAARRPLLTLAVAGFEVHTGGQVESLDEELRREVDAAAGAIRLRGARAAIADALVAEPLAA